MRTLLVALSALLLVPAVAEAAAPSIQVVSDRADLISAGDALVAIGLPAGTDPATVRVTDDGRDVTSAFALRPDGRFEGLVTGLSVGRNVLAASAPGLTTAHAAVTDHPNGGP